jgi:2-polyprenyl-3-methyl-5-hydroxy-6-metoxy-1,4-benzoquinol methylase
VNRNCYSEEAERQYYESSPEDRTALPYGHLDAYIIGSVGLEFFRGKKVMDIGAGEGIYSAWIADQAHGLQIKRMVVQRKWSVLN